MSVIDSILESDLRRFEGREDEHIEDDIDEFSRLYMWLYTQVEIPRRLPSYRELYCFTFDNDEFEELKQYVQEKVLKMLNKRNRYNQ